MCEAPVFYATTDGQTRRIAERLAEVLRAEGVDSAAIDIAATTQDAVDWSRVRGAMLGASLHAGHHQDAARAFARRHREQLNAHPSAFFSVSLSAASQRSEEVEAANRLARKFADDAGWTPQIVTCIAGRLAYTRYGWLKRWMMRRIAMKEGGPTDTTRDHELTDWARVTKTANEFADLLSATRFASRDAIVMAGAGSAR
jgi:menaquinone-dependent protoporphyrinogen oxidase